MLDATKIQSENEVVITGVLKELNIKKGESTKEINGTKQLVPWVSETARVSVDMPYGESVITVNKMASQLTKAGIENSNYKRILEDEENLKSQAACNGDRSQASQITISGEIGENLWWDVEKQKEVSNWQVNANFINNRRSNDKDQAQAEFTGYITKIVEELDKDENPTGRTKVTLAVIGYGGRINKVEVIADSKINTAPSFIEQNWNVDDTVSVTVDIVCTEKVITRSAERSGGFGKALEQSFTTYRNELIIVGASDPFDEDHAYDKDSIRAAMVQRKERLEYAKTRAEQRKAKAKASALAPPIEPRSFENEMTGF